MGNLVFQATLGGQVNLVGPNTASTFNLNVPATSSTIATLTGTETFTNKTLTTPTISQFSSASATNLTIQSAGTTAVTIDTSQNVGIGTSSVLSGYKVDVRGLVSSGATYGGLFSIYDTSGASQVGYFSSDAQAIANNDTNVAIVAAQTGKGIKFYTSGTNERMRIDSSGNLLVGTTSTYLSEKFNVTQSANQKASVLFNTNASYTNYVLNLRGSRNTSSSTWGFLQCSRDGVADVLYIYDSGNVVNANNSYGAISDVKLKENIVDATPKLANLMQVKVRNYNLKSDPAHKQLGVVAQELEQVFPAMIEETIDRDAENNDLGTTTKSVKYSVFIPMLIKAMQEQQALITAQAETINALTARIVALEAK